MVLEGQAPGPDFLNAACEVETDLAPAAMLAHIKRIEHDIGRRRTERWAPRPIDIDILLYGDRLIDEDTPSGRLTVPHPLLAERNFVVLPLAEIAPDALHPTLAAPSARSPEDMDFDGLTWLSGPAWAVAREADRAGDDDEINDAAENGASLGIGADGR